MWILKSFPLESRVSSGTGRHPQRVPPQPVKYDCARLSILFIGREADPQSTVKQVSPLPRHILRRVIERMRNLETGLSLQMLAKESGYSRVHFVRMFRAATGHSPHNYLIRLRLDRARELLVSPTLSLTDIALECGFSSHSHLSRVFRKVLGATPSEYRRSL